MQPGAIVREAWELYKTHWRTFVPLALIVYIILGLITLVFGLLLGWLGLRHRSARQHRRHLLAPGGARGGRP